jgi:hypothetical protein
VVERKRVFDSVSYELGHYNPAYLGAFGEAGTIDFPPRVLRGGGKRRCGW